MITLTICVVIACLVNIHQNLRLDRLEKQNQRLRDDFSEMIILFDTLLQDKQKEIDESNNIKI